MTAWVQLKYEINDHRDDTEDIYQEQIMVLESMYQLGYKTCTANLHIVLYILNEQSE